MSEAWCFAAGTIWRPRLTMTWMKIKQTTECVGTSRCAGEVANSTAAQACSITASRRGLGSVFHALTNTHKCVWSIWRLHERLQLRAKTYALTSLSSETLKLHGCAHVHVHLSVHCACDGNTTDALPQCSCFAETYVAQVSEAGFLGQRRRRGLICKNLVSCATWTMLPFSDTCDPAIST